MKKTMKNPINRTEIMHILNDILNSSLAITMPWEKRMEYSNDECTCIASRGVVINRDDEYIFSDIILGVAVYENYNPADPTIQYCVMSNKDVVFFATCEHGHTDITDFCKKKGWIEDIYFIHDFCKLIDHKILTDTSTSSKKEEHINLCF